MKIGRMPDFQLLCDKSKIRYIRLGLMMKKKEVTIKDLAELLVPKLWLIIIISVLASVFAFAYSRFFKNDTYTSTSILYVNSTSGENDNMTTGDNIMVASHMLDNYKQIIKRDNFLNMVVNDLADENGPYAEYKDLTKNLNASQISKMISISHYEDTQVFSLSVTSSNPKLSAVVLNAVHNNAVTNMAEIVPSAKIFAISSVQNPLQPEDEKSATQNSKHEVRNAVLSFMVAAVLSVVFVWIYSFFDVIIRDRKKLIDNVDIPILGVIPRHEIPIPTKGGEKDAV